MDPSAQWAAVADRVKSRIGEVIDSGRFILGPLVREVRPPRTNAATWLLAPAVAAFPLANLLDWPWALTGTGALWALAAGGLLAWRDQPL